MCIKSAWWWIAILVGVICVYFKSRSAIIVLTVGISKWVSCRLINRMRSWRACFVLFDSLINQYRNASISRSWLWDIRLLKFVMIIHNSKGIWNRIWRPLVGFAPQPSVFQINILVCGHFGGVFDKILPIWLDGVCFHVRHSTKIIFKYYVVLWTDVTCGGIPYKYDSSIMEGQVSKINPNTWTWSLFWWTCSSIFLEPSVQHVNWDKDSVKWFDWNLFHINSIHNRIRRSTFVICLQSIQPSSNGFHSKCPEYFVYHLWPHSHAMK